VTAINASRQPRWRRNPPEDVGQRVKLSTTRRLVIRIARTATVTAKTDATDEAASINRLKEANASIGVAAHRVEEARVATRTRREKSVVRKSLFKRTWRRPSDRLRKPSGTTARCL